MAPPLLLVTSNNHCGSLSSEQLPIIYFVLSLSSLCKGRTLYSVVRDAKIVLDVNKTRQIAQEIVKVPQGLGLPPEMHGMASDQQSGLKKKKNRLDLKNTRL